MTGPADEDLVPVSVRLGAVVPPEDPEDWTRPLTWVAALGMLAGPIVALVWFLAERPSGDPPLLGTYLVAAVLAGGAALTGSTQQGVARTWTATLGAGLFGALAVVVIGVVMAGERAVGSFPPSLAHAFAASVAGLAGAAAAAIAAGALARRAGRGVRTLVPIVAGVVVAIAAMAIVVASQPSAAVNDAAGCTTRLANATVAVQYPADWTTDDVRPCTSFGAAMQGAPWRARTRTYASWIG